MRKVSKKGAELPSSSFLPLKTFLETHPAISLISTGFVIATSIVGVMTYVDNSRIDLIEGQHKIEIANLNTKNEKILNEKIISFEKTIADLNFRISSIERRLPGSGPAYVDVASMMIGPEAVKALERQYKAFGGQDFFVAVPPMTDWRYAETNEYEQSLAVSQPQQPVHPLMKRLLENTKLYAWKEKPQIQITPSRTSLANFKQVTFEFHPTILVKKMDSDAFRSRMAMVEQLSVEMERVGDELDNLVSMLPGIIEKFNAGLGEIASKLRALGQSVDFQPVPIPHITSTRDERMALRQRAIDALTMFSSADLSSLMMMSIFSEFAEQISSGLVQHKVLSAQKKGDVFYIQSQFTFNNVQISFDGGPTKFAKKVSIDDEVFFFSRGSEGFLIRTTLPPVVNRSEAFAWIQAWLTGVRIPLG